MTTMPPAPTGQQDIAIYQVSNAPADNAIAFKFLNFVFDGIDGAFVEFRYFSSGRKLKVTGKSTYLEFPLKQEIITSEVLPHNGQLVIAFGPAPRCRIPAKGRAGQEHDILQVGCIWANLDSERAKGGAIELIARIRDFPLRPSIVINSGYGFHLYFVFHVPLRAGDLLVWNELIRDLRAALGTDAKVSLNEVMRLSGTLNIKEAHPVPCEILEEYSSWTRYSVEEIRRAIEESSSLTPSASSAFPRKTLQERGVSTDIIEAIITGRACTGIKTGASYKGNGGRDIWLASILLEKNFDAEEIKSIFRAHPHGCGSNWIRKKDGEKYLEQTLRKAVLRRNDGITVGGAWQEDDEDNPGSVLPPGYVLKEGSIWFTPPISDTDKKLPKSVLVSNSFIRIAGIHENIDTGEISLSIAFNYLGKTRFISILRSEMADSRKLVTALAGAGAPITSINARLVTAYLAAYEHAFASSIAHKKMTARFGRGRAGGQFFFPGLSSTIEFAPSSPGDAALHRAYSSRRGLLGGWLEVMRTLADETLMIPQVAILASLVPPLQSKLQIPNFILDIHGNSSTGKSTTLKLAASVYGSPYDPDSLVLQWMNTQVAVEQVAGLCSELPIYLDDAQHCPADLKRSLIYMIANGRGKGRSARGRGVGEVTTWHTVALSTSEEPLHECSPHEGARGRILSIGGITPPFRPGMASLVQSLERAVSSCHGHAGEAYICHLNGWTESDWVGWYRRYCAIREELVRSSSSNLVGRVSGYIAAIQLAAEIACPLLGLRFEADIVGAWLMLHLDEQQKNQNLILQALGLLADYYVTNLNNFAGDGSYDPKKRVTLHGLSERQKYIGFLRSTVENIFKSRKWNPTAVLNKLAESDALYRTEKGRHTKKVCIEKVTHRMICIKWSALLPEDISS